MQEAPEYVRQARAVIRWEDRGSAVAWTCEIGHKKIDVMVAHAGTIAHSRMVSMSDIDLIEAIAGSSRDLSTACFVVVRSFPLPVDKREVRRALAAEAVERIGESQRVFS